MAVSFLTDFSWQTNISSSFGISPGPTGDVSGDRQFLVMAWKDQSRTATISSPAGWTLIGEFADGAVSNGNGTGSMRIAVYYADGGLSSPTVTMGNGWSTSADILAYAIVVFSKDASETWDNPLMVSAAWPSSSSQTIIATSPVDISDGAVVYGVLAIRDDSSTFTRSTTAITATGPTWNGNYVEEPATHFSTTTNNDMSIDSGYRLITTGSTGIDLAMSATISASETGAAVWVVQNVTAGGGGGGGDSPAAYVNGGYYPFIRSLWQGWTRKGRILVPTM